MKFIYYCLFVFSVIGTSYGQSKAGNSAHYLLPEFKQGVVLMKTGIRNEALLNYNLVSQEMVFDKKGKKLALGWSNIVLIDTVFIEDRKFVLLDMNFVELLNNTSWTLYAAHNCKIRELGQPAGFGGTSETSAISIHTSISAGGFLYELELPNNYRVNPYTHYWLDRNGELEKFVNMKTLKKLYKGKKRVFKSYVKNHNITYKDQDRIITLIQYLQSS